MVCKTLAALLCNHKQKAQYDLIVLRVMTRWARTRSWTRWSAVRAFRRLAVTSAVRTTWRTRNWWARTRVSCSVAIACWPRVPGTRSADGTGTRASHTATITAARTGTRSIYREKRQTHFRLQMQNINARFGLTNQNMYLNIQECKLNQPIRFNVELFLPKLCPKLLANLLTTLTDIEPNCWPCLLGRSDMKVVEWSWMSCVHLKNAWRSQLRNALRSSETHYRCASMCECAMLLAGRRLQWRKKRKDGLRRKLSEEPEEVEVRRSWFPMKFAEHESIKVACRLKSWSS